MLKVGFMNYDPNLLKVRSHKATNSFFQIGFKSRELSILLLCFAVQDDYEQIMRLMIDRVHLQHFGKYAFEATNSIGTAIQSVTLKEKTM